MRPLRWIFEIAKSIGAAALLWALDPASPMEWVAAFALLIVAGVLANFVVFAVAPGVR